MRRILRWAIGSLFIRQLPSPCARGSPPPPVPERLRCLRKHLHGAWTAQRACDRPRDTIAHGEGGVGLAPTAWWHGRTAPHAMPHPHGWRLALAIASGDTPTANGGVWPLWMRLGRSSRAAPATGGHYALRARHPRRALSGAPWRLDECRGGGGGCDCGPSCDRVGRYGRVAADWRCANSAAASVSNQRPIMPVAGGHAMPQTADYPAMVHGVHPCTRRTCHWPGLRVPVSNGLHEDVCSPLWTGER